MAKSITLLDLSKEALKDERRALGSAGEELATSFLKRRGYRIVMTNFTVPIGRNRIEAQITGEIDLIALDGERLCFIEVKTRTSEDFATPLSAIDVRKQRQIIRAAKVYKRIFNISGIAVRYDAVTIVLQASGRPKIDLVKGFWNEQKFRKRHWMGDF